MSSPSAVERALMTHCQLDLQVKRAMVNGHEINWVEAGEGDPVVFLHGANFGWGMWYANLGALSESFQVLAPDLPGAGQSSPIDFDRVDFERDFVQTLRQWLDQQGIERFSVVGHSLGGWLGLRLALDWPERVQRVVVTDAVGFTDRVGPERIMGWSPFARFLTRTVFRPQRSNGRLEGFLRSAFANPQQDLPEAFVEYFYDVAQRSHSMLFMSTILRNRRHTALRSFLPQVQQPVMALWGQDDKIIPLEHCRAWLDRLPRGQLQVLEGAGHVPPVERPEAFNAFVRSFLLT